MCGRAFVCVCVRARAFVCVCVCCEFLSAGHSRVSLDVNRMVSQVFPSFSLFA